MSGWTDERVEQLKQFWTDGLSASQIARTLGGVSRNAVIGKAHRLRLTSRVERRTVARQKSAERIFVPPPPPPPVVLEPPAVLEDGSRVTVLTLIPAHCRWPIGDPQEPDFHFCGQKRERGSYCAAHAAMAYQPPPQPRGRAAQLAKEEFDRECSVATGSMRIFGT